MVCSAAWWDTCNPPNSLVSNPPWPRFRFTLPPSPPVAMMGRCRRVTHATAMIPTAPCSLPHKGCGGVLGVSKLCVGGRKQGFPFGHHETPLDTTPLVVSITPWGFGCACKIGKAHPLCHRDAGQPLHPPVTWVPRWVGVCPWWACPPPHPPRAPFTHSSRCHRPTRGGGYMGVTPLERPFKMLHGSASMQWLGGVDRV